MLQQTFILLTAAVLTFGSTAEASKKTVDECILEIRTRDVGSYAVDRLLDFQEEGVDISAARPALRSYLRQHVSSIDNTGVGKYGEGALLCLMRMGDKDAQDHFLIAQKRHLDQYLFAHGKTSSFPVYDLYEYYAALDTDHRAAGYELHSRLYQFLKPSLFGEKVETSRRDLFLNNEILVSMVRLAPDQKTQIKLLNDHYCFLHHGYHMFDGSGHWIRDLIYQLTSEPELFPQLPKDDSDKFKRMSQDYEALICFMAPNRADARKRFSAWMHSKHKNHKEGLVARYIDSASRMKPQARAEALVYLRKTGGDWYQRDQKLLERLDYKPHFMQETAEVLKTIRKTFGDDYLPTEQAKQVLKIETGLGTGF